MGTKREQERRRGEVWWEEDTIQKGKSFLFCPKRSPWEYTQCIGAGKEVVFRDASSVVRGGRMDFLFLFSLPSGG